MTMNKTATEWLNEARENGADWVDEAVENIALLPDHPHRRDFYQNLSFLLFCEFVWRKTPQGREYWTEIHYNLFESEN